MPSMLEQAVIDASLLKEAALKNAESLILEKYSSEIKEAVSSLLEGPDDMPEEDPLAGMGGETDATPGPEDPMAKKMPMVAVNGEKACPCPDDEEEVEIDFDQLAQQVNADGPPMTGGNVLEPGKEGGIQEAMMPADDGGMPNTSQPGIQVPAQIGPELHQYHMSMDDPIYKVGSLAYAGKPVPPELLTQAIENLQALEPKVDDPKDKEGLEKLIGELDALTHSQSDDASSRMPEEEAVMDSGLGLSEDLDEDMLENLLEMLTVDIKNVAQGHALRATEPQKKEAADIALAREQDTKVAEENKALRKAIAKLEENVKSLVLENNKVKSIAKQAGQKLNELNLENARLYYTNRILKSDSLNERQKQRLVETLSKVGSVNEAKVVFESMHSVNSVKGEKLPQTLTESINKGNVITLKTKTTSTVSPEKERMQRLAGIKSNR